MADHVLHRLKELQDEVAAYSRRSRTGDLPQFDPDGPDSFTSFLRQFNDVTNAHGYTLEERLRVLPVLLKGRARDVYDMLPVQLRTTGPWVDLIIRLQELIYPMNRQQEARAGLATLRQGSLNVSRYAEVLVSMAERAFPGMANANTRDAVLLTSFINGLNVDLLDGTYRARPATFREAVSAATFEESLRQLRNLLPRQNDIQRQIAALTAEVHALQMANRREFYVDDEGHSGTQPNDDFDYECSDEDEAEWYDEEEYEEFDEEEDFDEEDEDAHQQESDDTAIDRAAVIPWYL